jgi:DNA-binding transcriptional ArsR family regulator
MSTTQVARDLGLSAASVSEHLSVLRRSGLVSARRSGRSVLYQRTLLGTELLGAAVHADNSARTESSSRRVG